MSTPIYTPRAGSVADRVIRFLADNPDEVLSAADIAVKFDATRNNVHTLMALAVTAGMVTRTEDPDEGELVYRIGNGRADSPAPAPATTFGAHQPFPAKARRTPVRVNLDVAAITLQDDVPPPDQAAASMRSQLLSLLAGMKPGQSFAVPVSCRATVSNIATTLKKSGSGRWQVAAESNEHVRCWRLS